MKTQEKEQVQDTSNGLPKGISSKHSSEEFEMFEIEKSPMTIVRQHGEFYVILGKYRLSKPLTSIEEAAKDAERTDWDRLIQVMNCVAKIERKDSEYQETLNTEVNEN